jgi:hypothetical protein
MLWRGQARGQAVIRRWDELISQLACSLPVYLPSGSRVSRSLPSWQIPTLATPTSSSYRQNAGHPQWVATTIANRRGGENNSHFMEYSGRSPQDDLCNTHNYGGLVRSVHKLVSK